MGLSENETAPVEDLQSQPLALPIAGETVPYITQRLEGLVPSERRVAETLIAYSHQLDSLSASDIGKLAESSAATVVRTCQSLGFKGFQHLRILLLRDNNVVAQFKPQTEGGESDNGDTLSLLQQSISRAAQFLPTVISALEIDQLEQAAKVISEAKRVVIFASGASRASGLVLHIRLNSSGRPAEFPEEGIVQNLIAKQLGAEDVAIAISGSGLNRGTIQAAKDSNRAGAKVVSVTSYTKSDLASFSDHFLVAGASPNLTTTDIALTTAYQTIAVGLLGDIIVKELNPDWQIYASALEAMTRVIDPNAQ